MVDLMILEFWDILKHLSSSQDRLVLVCYIYININKLRALISIIHFRDTY